MVQVNGIDIDNGIGIDNNIDIDIGIGSKCTVRCKWMVQVNDASTSCK